MQNISFSELKNKFADFTINYVNGVFTMINKNKTIKFIQSSEDCFILNNKIFRLESINSKTYINYTDLYYLKNNELFYITDEIILRELNKLEILLTLDNFSQFYNKSTKLYITTIIDIKDESTNFLDDLNINYQKRGYILIIDLIKLYKTIEIKKTIIKKHVYYEISYVNSTNKLNSEENYNEYLKFKTLYELREYDIESILKHFIYQKTGELAIKNDLMNEILCDFIN